jgi:hypothetical protein
VIHNLPKTRSSKRWGVLLSLLCIALVILGGTLQVAHTHPGGDLSHADCSLCATAHVVAQVVSHPVPLPATLTITDAPSVKATSRQARLSIFALFTRPPPAASKLA